MWFDVAAALAAVEGGPQPAPEAHTPATSATTAANLRPESQLSRVSQPPEARPAALRVANVAGVARPQPAPSAPDGPDPPRHGRTATGARRTWTGRPVTPAEWRNLTEWQRHGPNGRHWCGIARAWIEQKGG